MNMPIFLKIIVSMFKAYIFFSTRKVNYNKHTLVVVKDTITECLNEEDEETDIKLLNVKSKIFI